MPMTTMTKNDITTEIGDKVGLSVEPPKKISRNSFGAFIPIQEISSIVFFYSLL